MPDVNSRWRKEQAFAARKSTSFQFITAKKLRSFCVCHRIVGSMNGGLHGVGAMRERKESNLMKLGGMIESVYCDIGLGRGNGSLTESHSEMWINFEWGNRASGAYANSAPESGGGKDNESIDEEHPKYVFLISISPEQSPKKKQV